MNFLSSDTIVALATAPLSAGVAVVRISGPLALSVGRAVCPLLPAEVSPRYAYYTMYKDALGETVDSGLFLFFPGPHSFTGEDVVELQCHGGRAVVKALLEALLAQPGVRAAEAGEFSKRAFLNGKMDLTAAEGLADLIAAETDAQRTQALRQMNGELAKWFEHWRIQLLTLLAHVEAAIDFPDEALDVLESAGVRQRLEQLTADLHASVRVDVGERMREGFSVAIVGRPNAGKSTLTNLLTGKETAIVSPLAGTTRDVVEAHLNIGGFPVVLADTAGVRDETGDMIEAEGVLRAKRKAEQADVTIVVAEASETGPSLMVEAAFAEFIRPGRTLFVWSGADRLSDRVYADAAGFLRARAGDLADATGAAVGGRIAEQVGAEGEGSVVASGCFEWLGEAYPAVLADLRSYGVLLPLLSALEGVVRDIYAEAGQGALISRQRHRAAVYGALEPLERALHLMASGAGAAELVAQDLREAALALGRVTGKLGSEDVLDAVFSTFCIGK